MNVERQNGVQFAAGKFPFASTAQQDRLNEWRTFLNTDSCTGEFFWHGWKDPHSDQGFRAFYFTDTDTAILFRLKFS